MSLVFILIAPHEYEQESVFSPHAISQMTAFRDRVIGIKGLYTRKRT